MGSSLFGTCCTRNYPKVIFLHVYLTSAFAAVTVENEYWKRRMEGTEQVIGVTDEERR